MVHNYRVLRLLRRRDSIIFLRDNNHNQLNKGGSQAKSPLGTPHLPPGFHPVRWLRKGKARMEPLAQAGGMVLIHP